MKKRLISLFLIVLLIGSISFAVNAINISDSTEAILNSNPYVQQYLLERGKNADEKSSSNNSQQRTSDMLTLIDIYNSDIEVGNILQKYLLSDNSISTHNYVTQATALNCNQIIQTMRNIETIYEFADESEKELMLSYLLHHAEACNDSQSIAFLKSLNNSNPIQLAANYSYNPTAGVNYALNWWHRFNTDNYPALDRLENSGDCTNFVSQCLKAGGVTFRANWYCYKKNSNNPHPTTIAKLNESWNLSDPSPWISIKPFTSYWYSQVTVKSYNLQQYKDRHAEIYATEIAKGDIVIFKSGILGVNWPAHAMIISDYDKTNKDFLCAGHTNARNYYPILTALNSENYSGVDFYLF